ncbi:AFR227Wp [Eremothecium gossypii ATCC 10895]|uniref:AFR227Wp n=1 Tax=Eremothecium gossypii (strain ATCC 10895 / CBS 109.51 / FGSC 9923 / NRRL Y-1056) TaxID=284811 RepID=Q753U8_EREGS|nr:AFR227Wp [Eremothecium gossypii ATCC 10895]AAS53598.2 AFR227Wp [Eremothecium gossypii ATCC 10895]AEY97911.1 FAFR227Wp [Eremothecium gossypii FDAG1]
MSRGVLLEALARNRQPKVITFDAYNCLFSTRLPVAEQYSAVGRRHGVDVAPSVLAARFPAVFRETSARHPDYGKYTGLSVQGWWTLVIQRLFKPAEVGEKMVAEILQRFQGHGAYKVFPDALWLLEELRVRRPEVVVGVLSNSDPTMRQVLLNLGLGSYFTDAIYLSYDLGAKKPERRAFDAALERILERNPQLLGDLGAEELRAACWHVGDEKSADLCGATGAGWNGILVDRQDIYGQLGQGSAVALGLNQFVVPDFYTVGKLFGLAYNI